MSNASDIHASSGSGGNIRAASIELEDVADVLGLLVDRSLAVFDQSTGRYRLTETVRHYARERLMVSREADKFRSIHRDHFLILAEEAEPNLTGPHQAEWFTRLETEHDNLRAALDHSVEYSVSSVKDSRSNLNAQHPTLNTPAEAGLRLAGSLWRFWMTRGYVTEGRLVYAALLDKAGPRAAAPGLGRAMHGAGTLAYLQGDYEEARSFFQRAADIRRELGDRAGEAGSLGNLGTVAHTTGEYESARLQFESSLAILQELGELNGVAISLTCLGNVASDQGDYQSAREFLVRAVALNQEIGNRLLEANALNNLGTCTRNLGNHEAARNCFEMALEINRELDSEYEVALNLINLAYFERTDGRSEIARSNLIEALQILRKLGARRGQADWLEAWADIEEDRKQFSRAARLLGAARRLREEIGIAETLGAQSDLERAMATLRAKLGETELEWAIDLGHDMTLDQAVEYALAERD